MYDNNIGKFQYKKYIHYIRRLYNNSALIRDQEWEHIQKLAATMDRINKQEDFLKSQALIDHFLGGNIEDFVVLTQNYQKLLKVAIDTSDYLKKQLGRDIEEEDIIFNTDADALKAIEIAFEDIEKIKNDNETYLTKDIEPGEELILGTTLQNIQPSEIVFNIGDNKAIGKLFKKDGKLCFDGDVNSSAQVLFNLVCDMFNK